MDKKEEINNPPITIFGIADSVEFESNHGMVKLLFFTSLLNQKLFPNHKMKIAEVVLEASTARLVAKELMRHGERGTDEAKPTIEKISMDRSKN